MSHYGSQFSFDWYVISNCIHIKIANYIQFSIFSVFIVFIDKSFDWQIKSANWLNNYFQYTIIYHYSPCTSHNKLCTHVIREGRGDGQVGVEAVC